MIFLFLHPKAIGIENSVRMATRLAPAPSPSSRYSLPTRSPTNFARSLSQQLMGKPGDTAEELVDEFEELVGLLEKGGHIEPDGKDYQKRARLLEEGRLRHPDPAGDRIGQDNLDGF